MHVLPRHPPRSWLGVALCASALAGCAPEIAVGRPAATPNHAVTVSEAAAARCVRGASGPQSPYRDELAGEEADPDLAAHLSVLSPMARRAGLAAGVEPLLASLLRERALAHGVPTLAFVAKRQDLEARLAGLGAQGLTVEFEAECIIALIHDTIVGLDDEQQSRELAIGITSLIVGAVAATAQGAWELTGTSERGPIALGISGAGASAVLAGAAFVPRPRPVIFVHEHNLLEPLWVGEDPERLYPSFVFRVMTLPMPGGRPTPRDLLLREWRDLIAEVVPEDERATAEALLFGVGGVYDPEILALRQRLFEALESAVDSISRDVDLLLASAHAALERTVDENASP